ncbi:MAG: hypothetical protein FJZ86_13055 [Chloroflexi bacterium]|nr:hypothetical protein [Chloroflexota bacterium]
MFVAGSGSADTWTLTHFDWKRHHEGYAAVGDPIPVEEEIANGLEFYAGSHPILYVSEYKHAMYPTANACEDYPFNVDLLGGASCNVNPEDCANSKAGRLEVGLPYISPDYNVGELTDQLMDELPGYPGEYAWHGISFEDLADGKEMFCGSLPPRGDTLKDEPCAGSMANMWFNEVTSPYDR